MERYADISTNTNTINRINSILSELFYVHNYDANSEKYSNMMGKVIEYYKACRMANMDSIILERHLVGHESSFMTMFPSLMFSKLWEMRKANVRGLCDRHIESLLSIHRSCLCLQNVSARAEMAFMIAWNAGCEWCIPYLDKYKYAKYGIQDLEFIVKNVPRSDWAKVIWEMDGYEVYKLRWSAMEEYPIMCSFNEFTASESAVGNDEYQYYIEPNYDQICHSVQSVLSMAGGMP